MSAHEELNSSHGAPIRSGSPVPPGRSDQRLRVFARTCDNTVSRLAGTAGEVSAKGTASLPGTAALRKVLLISPHFPPDSAAAAHRVRIMAPYLPAYGWQPTVLTCEPEAYEGHLDVPFEAFVPRSVRVVRCPALPVAFTRRLGIGDLGLRSFPGLLRRATELLRAESYAALFITIFPAYTALLGPILVRRFRVPFVVDYQDPWVGAWGQSVGGGPQGVVDLKSRISLRLAQWLEPRVVRAAGAITAVSAGTYEPILRRHPEISPVTAAIPIGTDPQDFQHSTPVTLPFDPSDGLVHICYTGTVLPLGVETLTAVLSAVARMRDSYPSAYARLRLHFIGTSNQTTPTETLRVVPLARSLGVADVVREIPVRVPYSTIVEIQKHATALLALGSSEPHYTASKIFPLLLARRPLLAAYHERSSVIELLSSISREPSVRVVAYSEREPVARRVDQLLMHLLAIVERPTWSPADVRFERLDESFAPQVARKFAAVFDQVANGRRNG